MNGDTTEYIEQKHAICNISIAIPIPHNATEQEAVEIAENYELPREYVEDSFEFVEIN